MPRDASGNYTLPAGNPVVTGTTISTTWANPTMSDLANEMTDSLSRSGLGGMTAPLRGPDGNISSPTFSFTGEQTTGRYRAGPGEVREAVLGVDVVRYTTSGLEEWTGLVWQPITGATAATVPYDPSTSILTSTNVQEAIDEVAGLAVGSGIEAGNVSYDDTVVYFNADNVQDAIDTLGVDLGNIELLPPVLPVARGGTGQTTSTGSSSVVLADGPTINNPTIVGGATFSQDINGAGLDACNLDQFCVGITQSPGNNSSRIATTAFVQSAVPLESSNYIEFQGGLILSWGTSPPTLPGAYSNPGAATILDDGSSWLAIGE